MIGLVGKKVGMTRIFTEDGVSIPVTVIEVEANRVTQVKDLANDGYRAIQVTTGAKKANRVTKPEAGHFAKAGVEAGRGLWEFRLAEGEEFTVGQSISVELFADVKKVDVTGTSKGKGFAGTVKRWNFRTQDATQVKDLANDGYRAIQVTTGAKKANRVTKPEAGHFAKAGVEAGRGLWEFRLAEGEEFTVGQSISVELFADVKKVDVTGTSKGKGFAGTVKRWNFRTQDATHGNSLSHRVPGSIGQNQTPGKVFKGKKMAGQMGNERVTVQSLDVVRVDAERNLLLVKGAVPGATGSDLIVKPAVKA